MNTLKIKHVEVLPSKWNYPIVKAHFPWQWIKTLLSLLDLLLHVQNVNEKESLRVQVVKILFEVSYGFIKICSLTEFCILYCHKEVIVLYKQKEKFK